MLKDKGLPDRSSTTSKNKPMSALLVGHIMQQEKRFRLTELLDFLKGLLKTTASRNWGCVKESFGLSADKLEAVGEELADIFVYLVRLADQLGVDLPAAVERKIELNEKKYPADVVRGSAKKYTEY